MKVHVTTSTTSSSKRIPSNPLVERLIDNDRLNVDYEATNSTHGVEHDQIISLIT